MRKRLYIEPWTYLSWSLLVLILHLDWLFGAFFAALFHEVCHIAAISLVGGSVLEIHIGPCGAVIDTCDLSKSGEFWCALAGPAGSCALILFCRWCPILAVCGLVHGIFNLLPVYPLDGGRALRCSLEILLPDHAGVFCGYIECFVLLLLLVSSIWAARYLNMGFFPVVFALLLILKAIIRKIPCKRSQIRVQ